MQFAFARAVVLVALGTVVAAVTSFTPTSRIIRSNDGTNIFAEAIGDPTKPSIVWIHGITFSGIVFDEQFQDQRYLDELFMVRFDLRGHGRSGKPTNSQAYGSLQHAQDFQAVIRAFNLQSPVLAGWSLGGFVISDVFQHLPANTISGAIDMASVVVAPANGGAPPSGGGGANFGGLGSNTNVTLHNEAILSFVDLCFADPNAVPFSTKMSWVGVTVLQPPGVLGFVASRAQDKNNLFRAGQSGFPMLFLAGDRDNLVNGVAVAGELRRRFTNLEVVTFRGAGHSFFFEQPDATRDAILRFMRRV